MKFIDTKCWQTGNTFPCPPNKGMRNGSKFHAGFLYLIKLHILVKPDEMYTAFIYLDLDNTLPDKKKFLSPLPSPEFILYTSCSRMQGIKLPWLGWLDRKE